MESIDAVYLLCHPEKEPSRWKRLQEHLRARGIPESKWVQMAPTWGTDLKEDVFTLYDPFAPRPGCPYLTWKGRNLSMGEISLVLNFWCGVDHAMEHGYKVVLFLESDVFLRDDFAARMGDLMRALEGKPWDYVSLSDGVGTRPPARDGASLYAPTQVFPPPHSFPFRCTDSMLFRVEGLAKMRKAAFPFRECLDWELNWQLANARAIPLWADPPLVEQGTVKSRMVSTLPA
jgi:hypothetical protein